MTNSWLKLLCHYYKQANLFCLDQVLAFSDMVCKFEVKNLKGMAESLCIHTKCYLKNSHQKLESLNVSIGCFRNNQVGFLFCFILFLLYSSSDSLIDSVVFLLKKRQKKTRPMICFAQKRISRCRWPVVWVIPSPLPPLHFHFRINSGSCTFFGPSNFCPQ